MISISWTEHAGQWLTADGLGRVADWSQGGRPYFAMWINRAGMWCPVTAGKGRATFRRSLQAAMEEVERQVALISAREAA